MLLTATRYVSSIAIEKLWLLTLQQQKNDVIYQPGLHDSVARNDAPYTTRSIVPVLRPAVFKAYRIKAKCCTYRRMFHALWSGLSLVILSLLTRRSGAASG